MKKHIFNQKLLGAGNFACAAITINNLKLITNPLVCCSRGGVIKLCYYRTYYSSRRRNTKRFSLPFAQKEEPPFPLPIYISSNESIIISTIAVPLCSIALFIAGISSFLPVTLIANKSYASAIFTKSGFVISTW